MSAPFDPAAWLAEADSIGMAPMLTSSVIEGVASTGLFHWHVGNAGPDGDQAFDREREAVLVRAINPNNEPAGKSNFRAVVDHLLGIGRVAS